jgi:Winged helix DNA-binding domain
MKPVHVARLRLEAQQLVDPPDSTPAQVVARLGAVQSQDWFGGAWGLGLRGRTTTAAQVERALADGSILRTHVLRPTWHFVAPADIRWMLALTGARIRAACTSRQRWLELDDVTLRRSAAVMQRALAGGRAMTRAELADVLRDAGVRPDGQRMPHVLMDAELDGLLVSGPRRGKQFTWALLEERVPPAPADAPAERDAMLGELARRYFPTRGPATAHDFAWWSGLTVGDARRAADILGDALARVEIDGVAHWTGADADLSPRPRAGAAPVAHFLPNYDEYFIGHSERGAMLARVRAAGGDVDNVALSGHLLAVDGQVVAFWTRTTTPKATVVEVTPLVDLSARDRKAVDRAALALGAHLEQPVTVARPTAGALTS